MRLLRFFFFKQKTAYEMAQCDWSSDVCSSDLAGRLADRVDVDEVGRDRRAHPLTPLAGLLTVAEAHVDPGPVDQARPGRRSAFGQVPPVAQCVVHGVAQGGVCALAALLRRGPVEVLQPVAAGAVEEGEQLAGARG